ncbi:hypothetical protein NEIMUCOT_04559 [Neisseria mucosa ATCC 25996]|uniref:Uncharacterized protein n=1 Tax=Neisseria mucosa (strain ATCC 25996 / DSM 4631 / NCTC 10774 / M26) TaxID=546266 RepID=D2ZVB6_NEIM2|nr:hypothetical protein NEIMUCOT_04559 [Neisseria mucosa ATCC 25996]
MSPCPDLNLIHYKWIDLKQNCGGLKLICDIVNQRRDRVTLGLRLSTGIFS